MTAERCTFHGLDMVPVQKRFLTLDRTVAPTNEVDWYCPKCGDEAIAKQTQEDHDRRGREAAEATQQRKQAELETRIGAAAIPARYCEYTFDTFPRRDGLAQLPRVETVIQTLRSYANRWQAMRKQGISILMLGGAGTGKTGLACSVANHIMREDRASALFMSAYGAVRHQRDTWGRKGRSEREALDDLLSPDLLLLDEVGASVGTDSEMSALFEVLNGRYAERKPTILLSNLPMDDYTAAGVQRPGLRSFLGPRVIDRFRDDGSFTLSFDWPSLRGARA